MGQKTKSRMVIDVGKFHTKEGMRAWEGELAARMREASQGCSLREIGLATGCNWETVRRYLARGRVSGWFLAAFCDAFSVHAEWLVHGRGARDRSVQHASPTHPPEVMSLIELKQGRERRPAKPRA
jgi:hypothetical protein